MIDCDNKFDSLCVGVETMSLIESDLLAALKELHEASLAMTSGKLHTGNEMERYNQAIAWSERVITLAEKTK